MVRRWAGRLVRGGLQGVGVLSLLWVLSAATPLPWALLGWLAADLDSGSAPDPAVLVVLGGGGIPSESGLTRTFEAARMAHRFPQAQVVVAMTQDGKDPAAERMADELVMRGVARSRILFEPEGRNTWEQAVNAATLLGVPERQPAVAVVTSPEHMRRALLSFRQAGFARLRAAPSWSTALDVDLTMEAKDEPSTGLPRVGSSMMARYRFWDNLVIQAKLIREFTALAYYRRMGWN